MRSNPVRWRNHRWGLNRLAQRLRLLRPTGAGSRLREAGEPGSPLDRIVVSRHLRGFANRDVLVIAETYAPAAVGGAEISLHNLLRESGVHRRCLVVRFAATGETANAYRHDGVDVLVLPRSSVFGSAGRHGNEHALARTGRRAMRTVSVAAGSGSLASPLAVRWAAIRMASARKRTEGGLLLDALPERNRDAALWLNALLKWGRFPTVIADNARSVLVASDARAIAPFRWNGKRTIAIVRDNRFFCARRTQLVHVRGRLCAGCTFECASEDAPRAPKAQAVLLQALQQRRQGALRQFDDVIVTSEYLKRQVTAMLAPGQRLAQVPNFVRSRFIAAAAAGDAGPAPATATAKNGEERLVCIGALSPAKGQLLFVEDVLDRLHERPQLHVDLAGRGPAVAARIRERIATHPQGERVHLRGFLGRKGVAALIQKAAIVVLPTIWPEPFGRVPLEAAWCGKPVVGFRVGALPETVKHGQTGLLVEPGDYDSFWSAVTLLLEDETLRSDMGNRAFEQVRSESIRAFAIETFLALLNRREASETSGGSGPDTERRARA